MSRYLASLEKWKDLAPRPSIPSLAIVSWSREATDHKGKGHALQLATVPTIPYCHPNNTLSASWIYTPCLSSEVPEFFIATLGKEKGRKCSLGLRSAESNGGGRHEDKLQQAMMQTTAQGRPGFNRNPKEGASNSTNRSGGI